MQISKEIMAMEERIRINNPVHYRWIKKLLAQNRRHEAILLISRGFETTIGTADMMIRYLLDEEEIDTELDSYPAQCPNCKGWIWSDKENKELCNRCRGRKWICKEV